MGTKPFGKWRSWSMQWSKTFYSILFDTYQPSYQHCHFPSLVLKNNNFSAMSHRAFFNPFSILPFHIKEMNSWKAFLDISYLYNTALWPASERTAETRTSQSHSDYHACQDWYYKYLRKRDACGRFPFKSQWWTATWLDHLLRLEFWCRLIVWEDFEGRRNKHHFK